MLRGFTIFIVFCLFAAAAAVSNWPARSEGSTVAPGEETTADTNRVRRDSVRAEQILAEQVRRALVRLPSFSVFDHLEYRVRGRTVELYGQVSRPILKSDAENVVKRLEGAERVVSYIEVLPVSFYDDRIRLAVYRAIFTKAPLQRYGMSPVPSIHIIVKHGHVTLAGVVANEADRNLAGLAANSVPGTFSVTNNLRIESRKS